MSTEFKLGRLSFHTQHDQDTERYHDHTCDMWIYPLVSYVEVVYDRLTGKINTQVVPKFVWKKQDARYTHRIIGAWGGKDQRHGLKSPSVVLGLKVTSVVWSGRKKRTAGYFVDGMWLPASVYEQREKRGE